MECLQILSQKSIILDFQQGFFSNKIFKFFFTPWNVQKVPSQNSSVLDIKLWQNMLLFLVQTMRVSV